MSLAVHLNAREQWEELKALPADEFDELIIDSELHSRWGRCSLAACRELARELRDRGKRVSLNWDRLMTADQWQQVLMGTPDSFWEEFDSVRTLDPGAFEFVLEHTSLPLHVHIDHGHHNLLGLQALARRGGPRLQSLSPSLELPFAKLREYQKELVPKLEILLWGRLLLFSTPRPLLTPFEREQQQRRWIERLGHSEESVHRGFPLLNNQYGTFMFHPKDYGVLDEWPAIGEHFKRWRLDLRFHPVSRLWSSWQSIRRGDREALESLKKEFPHIKGFFRANRSDKQFIHLKNQRVDPRQEHFLGQVLESKKGSYLAIQVQRDLPLGPGTRLRARSPEGKEKNLSAGQLKTLSGGPVQTLQRGGLYLHPHVAGLVAQSIVWEERDGR